MGWQGSSTFLVGRIEQCLLVAGIRRFREAMEKVREILLNIRMTQSLKDIFKVFHQTVLKVVN